MLCDTCQEVIKDLENTRGRGSNRPHHHCMSCFNRSLEKDCYVCYQLFDMMPSDEMNVVRRATACSLSCEEAMSHGKTVDSAFTISEICDASMDHETPQSSYCWKFRFAPHLDYNISEIKVFLKPVSTSSHSTNSDESISTALQWIQDCLQNHRCGTRETMNKPWHPSRLLYCGSDSNPACRLVDTNETEVKGPYMTLSHCWGKSETLRLTTENREALAFGIAVESLPRLYRETLEVVRRLGIEYLWIDSLCIIQDGDDSADWHREVTQMTDIYANSYCNVSALRALDSNDSLFSQSEAPLQASQLESIGQATFLVNSHLFWQDELTYAEYGLNSRAWVLQERLVSPRILHFGASQLMWECRQRDASESHPGGLPSRITQHFPSNLRFKDLLPDASAQSSRIDHYIRWMDIVRRYSGCRLTYPSDKLPAISAAARLFGRTLKDEYVAGLWLGDLDNQLRWLTSRLVLRTDTGTEKEEYRCPSWSWASTNEDVVWHDWSSPSLVQVTQMHLDHVTSDSTGPITSGWLQLKGLLRRLSISACQCDSSDHWISTIGDIKFDCQWPNPTVYLDSGNVSSQIEKMTEQNTLYCMIATTGNPEEPRPRAQALIFELLDRGRGIYRRIGLLHDYGYPLLVEQLRMAQPDQAYFSCERYEDSFHYIQVV